MSAISAYLKELRHKLAGGDATEHTHRPALQRLLEGLRPALTVVNEPRHTEAGAVDFIVRRQEQPIGWVEAKDIGADLGKIARTDQLTRYLGAYPNLILTDYVAFRLYLNGKLVDEQSLGVVDGAQITSTVERQQAVAALLDTFVAQEVYRPGKPEDLARRMAHFARMAEAAIVAALNAESERGQLHSQMAAFRETLLPDLSEEQFADMYAQTIAYGLFAAKCHHPLGDDFSRWTAARYLPPTNPFLQRLFHELTGPGLDPEVEWVVDGLVSLLRNTEMQAIVEAFARHQQGREDPVVHFYETFLKEYNPRERKIRGVYYTPEPVVSYIVRSVDHLLKTEFDKPLGLADDSVFILDPACGTGTFLYFVIEHIYRTITKDGRDRGAWPGYVREKLLGRLFGFELLMAPYTIAHLKLAQQLREQGYDFPDDQRLGIYLTNTLEDVFVRTQSAWTQFIEREGREAKGVKHMDIMVVLGNPPYAGHSANASERDEVDARGIRRRRKTWIGQLIDDYKRIGAQRLQERNLKWLQDDYVKFLRFGEWRIRETGWGVLAFITNHGYLENPTFRGMRAHLARTFTHIRVLDLHGNSKKKERSPDGTKDENVFDIQAGVAIGLLARRKGVSTTTIEHAEVFGERQCKYDYLNANDVSTTRWCTVTDASESCSFAPLPPDQLQDEYLAAVAVPTIFRAADGARSGIGVCTHNDGLLTDVTREALEDRLARLEDPTIPDDVLSRELGMPDGKYWRMSRERAKLRAYPWRQAVVPYLYRPFTWNWIVYQPDLMEIGRGGASKPVMEHLLHRANVALLTTRQTRDPFGALATADVCSHKSLSAYDGTYVFPLYLHPQAWTQEHEHGAPRRPNLNPAFIADLAGRLGLTFIADGRGDLGRTADGDGVLPPTPSLKGGGRGNGTFGPEDVFHYLYAVLHSPTYRRRYAEFLKMDFPRIPLTSDLDLFGRLCDLGAELVALHLLKSPLLHDSPATYPEKGSDVVEAVRYDEAHERVYINKTQYFGGIGQGLYEFQVGGYQVLSKWLKDRKGRTLSYGDITHYQQVAAALTHTRRLMSEIDAAIPGWPLP